MSKTATVKVTNSSGSTAWLEVADASHEYVTMPDQDFTFYVGDDDPNVLASVPSMGYISIVTSNGVAVRSTRVFTHLNAKLWVQLGNNKNLTVMRGQGYVAQ